MRKNKGRSVKIDGVYSVFRVKGINFERLINNLKKENVEIKNLKRLTNKEIEVSVKVSSLQKFFAITDNLCYNIKKIRDSGRLLWLYRLIVNPFLVLGIALFSLTLVLSNDLVFGILYTGNGNVYSNEVEKYLLERQVTTFSRFSNIDVSTLADDILKDSKRFSFVTCSKQGNYLRIELILKENDTHIKDLSQKDLVCSLDGVVDKIYLYSGTALVKEGQEVKAGDLLVGGYAVIKDKTVEVNPIAVVTIKITKEYVYVFDIEEKEKAEIFALNEKENGKIAQLKEEKVNEKYYYKVKVEYKENLYTG
ncbi:MAG: sporulation protein YqfD [Clostridia bacterium]|nr:sporulation protein YqfD [Clostridia bacterium]